MIRARSAAGTLASECEAVARLPLELWAATEDALIDIGWSAARRQHFPSDEEPLRCDCVPACDFVEHGINERTFDSAKLLCQRWLAECWYEAEIGHIKHYAKARCGCSILADLLSKCDRSLLIIISLSSTLSAVVGGMDRRGAGRRRL